MGPYSSMKAVIESLVSSTATHSCFDEDDDQITIYFLPWLKMKGEKEFRIFVFQNEITGNILFLSFYSLESFFNY